MPFTVTEQEDKGEKKPVSNVTMSCVFLFLWRWSGAVTFMHEEDYLREILCGASS